MRFFGLKSCDTCRKALRQLREAGHEPEVMDVRADGVGPQDLDRMLSLFGDDLVNRRSTTWRGLNDAERGRPANQLLREFPTLMKRPVIEHNGEMFLGWGDETRVCLLGESHP